MGTARFAVRCACLASAARRDCALLVREALGFCPRARVLEDALCAGGRLYGMAIRLSCGGGGRGLPCRGVGSRSISSYEYVGLVCRLDLLDFVDLRRLVVAAAWEAECIGGRDALSGIASSAPEGALA